MFYAVNEATVNNFVGLFIIFLPRVVLFRVATLHIACVAGVLRGGKGERGKTRAQSAGGPWYFLPPVLIFTFVPLFLWPATQATLHNVIVATEYVLGCLKCCYHDHQMQKRLMVVGVMNK